jgi:hypothetical protein
LEDAGIKLDSVAADVLGVSGRAMLTALVPGERDPRVLAELAKGRLRAKLPQLRQALRGRFRGHHALLIRLAMAHLEQLEASIAELDTQIDRVLAPFAQARDRLDTIIGVGKRAAETIVACGSLLETPSVHHHRRCLYKQVVGFSLQAGHGEWSGQGLSSRWAAIGVRNGRGACPETVEDHDRQSCHRRLLTWRFSCVFPGS